MSKRVSGDRLNAFVDAAFAFAVTLVVVGAGGASGDRDGLYAVVRDAPAFLAGFILLAMFWHGHVRWRAIGLGDGSLSVLLSLGLVFCVLMYVHPLRLMSLSIMDLTGLGGPTDLATLNMRDLFALYGLIFFLLAGLLAGLFLQSWRDPLGDDRSRAIASGEFGVWAILAGAGGLSLAIATLTPVYFLAPWVYPFLGPAIGLFVWRHKWTLPAEVVDTPAEPEVGASAIKVLTRESANRTGSVADQKAAMTLTLYGIPNCDTVKKARDWLGQHGVAHTFHDYKKSGVDRAWLERWTDEHGWETVLNRAGTTFRKLPEADRQDLDRDKAIDLMLAQPSMIKRPVLDLGGRTLVGFKPDAYAAVLV